jgi:diguanylate cyclase (GGDEF)-like protein
MATLPGTDCCRRLRSASPELWAKSDIPVRWGGEEFLIMSRSTDPSGTPAFCSRIPEVMASEPSDLGNAVSVRKTCSIGWAPYPGCSNAFEAICAEDVIELADTALYRAKALGRNQSIGVLPSDEAITSPGRPMDSPTARPWRSRMVR